MSGQLREIVCVWGVFLIAWRFGPPSPLWASLTLPFVRCKVRDHLPPQAGPGRLSKAQLRAWDSKGPEEKGGSHPLCQGPRRASGLGQGGGPWTSSEPPPTCSVQLCHIPSAFLLTLQGG